MGPDVVTAYQAVAALAERIPAGARGGAGRAAGKVAARLDARRRFLVRRHLRRVVGSHLGGSELDAMVDAAFASYARYYIDSFRLPKTPIAEVDTGFTHEGFEHLVAAREAGTAPILVMPHLGSWEWAGFWLALVPGFRVTAVAEALDPPELYEWFLDFRRGLGMNILTLGAPETGPGLLQAIKDRDIVVLLADRDVGGSSVEVEFFGEMTRMPAGPAMMGLRTGAPLLPTAVYLRDHGCHGIAKPPVETVRRGKLRDDVRRVTQDLAHELEALIRVAPEQWHLMQPNWPSDHEALASAGFAVEPEHTTGSPGMNR